MKVKKMIKIILASKSKVRKDILDNNNIPNEVKPSSIDEDVVKESLIKEFISEIHIKKIIEAGFDWMIGQQKVAVKAYTMNTLFLLGKNYDWVHQELKLIIQQNIMNESAAYKARGRITLALINKQ